MSNPLSAPGVAGALARSAEAALMPRFQSRSDGEYRLCTRCFQLGYGDESYHPTTREFWPVARGSQLRFRRCRACASELGSRRAGVVPVESAHA